MRSVSWKGEDVSGSNGSGNQASVRVAIPLDEPSPEAALDEVVMLVRHLGAAVKRIDRTAAGRAGNERPFSSDKRLPAGVSLALGGRGCHPLDVGEEAGEPLHCAAMDEGAEADPGDAQLGQSC